MSYWYSATAERLNAKDMIAIEIEQKKLEERNNLVSKDSFEYDFYVLKFWNLAWDWTPEGRKAETHRICEKFIPNELI